MKGIILGAGFTGLAAGIKTGFPIFEASNKAGGICSSYVKDGFQFSVGGGHWVFGKGLGYDYIKSQVILNEYERKAGVYYNHTFPYPFQTTAEKPNVYNSDSMKGWLRSKFSNESCNMFFYPFNKKYTAGLYDEIIQDDDYKSPPAGSVGFVSTFGDPVGGLGVLVDKMSSQCDIRYGKKAIQVIPEIKTVLFEDGTSETYDKLISTIPLNRLLTACGKTDFRLPYTSVMVLNIGAWKGRNHPKEHWLYVPFCKSGFYRIGFYSNVDASKAPEGKVSLSVEMAFRDSEPQDMNISEKIIEELQSWGMISGVIVSDPTYVQTAYTWLYDKDDAKKEIQWLKERDIISTGRYGKWKFQGMVESIKDGLTLEVL